MVRSVYQNGTASAPPKPPVQNPGSTSIFVRFQRTAGHRAHYITGADEHGTYTLVKARKVGQGVSEVAQKHIDEILQCLRALHITPDVFVRTSSELHKDNALAIFRELQEAGYVEVRKGVQLYCEYCDEFVADSLATGNCTTCNSATDSNLCENCGLAIRHDTLCNARHTTCDHNLALRSIEQAVFDTPRLTQALDKAPGQSPYETRRELGWRAICMFADVAPLQSWCGANGA